jgi:hypothetical protein
VEGPHRTFVRFAFGGLLIARSGSAHGPTANVADGCAVSRGRVVDSALMDPLDWVCEQGVVLQSARGPVPNLAEQIAGEPIRGSWWGHSSGHEIFAVLTRVLDSPDVIATRVVDGMVTLVHRRVWPALVRVADRFPAERLAAVDEVHTASGAHRTMRPPSPSGSPPKTSPPRRCSPSTRRSRCCPPASADGRHVRHRSGQVPAGTAALDAEDLL